MCVSLCVCVRVCVCVCEWLYSMSAHSSSVFSSVRTHNIPCVYNVRSSPCQASRLCIRVHRVRPEQQEAVTLQ